MYVHVHLYAVTHSTGHVIPEQRLLSTLLHQRDDWQNQPGANKSIVPNFISQLVVQLKSHLKKVQNLIGLSALGL